jgi:hypothetical protein
VDPFTVQEGVLELNEGTGAKDGPRRVDSGAGVVRWGESDRTLPIAELRAVAVVYVERDVWRRVRAGRAHLAREMRHAVVLVPQRVPPEVASLLDGLRAGTAGSAPGFAIRLAAGALDGVSIPFVIAGSALVARRIAKAVARTAGLEMIELYGEGPVFRPAGRLDLSLRDEIARRPPPPDPGPPPAGLVVTPHAEGFELSFAPPPASTKRLPRMLVVGGVAAAVAVVAGLLGGPAGVVALLLFLGVVAVVVVAVAGAPKRMKRARLVVEAERLVWYEGEREDAVAVSALEMIRIHEGTLVLVDQQYETRCNLGGDDHAAWARGAIEHSLITNAAPYR